MNKQLIAVSRTILSFLPLLVIAEPNLELRESYEVTPNSYQIWDVVYEGNISDIVSEQNEFIVTTMPTWKILSSEYMDLTKTKFTKWTCTDYIASRRPELFLDKYSWSRLIHGNAKDRLLQANKFHIPIGNKPQVWAIAVFKPGKWALSLWHVAYVEYVWTNWKIIVSDMNFKEKHLVTQRIISASMPIGYIY